MLNKLRTLFLRPVAAVVALAVLATGASVAMSQPAQARIFIGVGVGVPVYYPPPYYAYPPPYYYPPPVVYAPPVMAPPPVVGTPTSEPYTATNGQTCREYQTTVTVDGQQQPSHGTACLQPDGSWRIVN
jgi:hypothetical protein